MGHLPPYGYTFLPSLTHRFHLRFPNFDALEVLDQIFLLNHDLVVERIRSIGGILNLNANTVWTNMSAAGMPKKAITIHAQIMGRDHLQVIWAQTKGKVESGLFTP